MPGIPKSPHVPCSKAVERQMLQWEIFAKSHERHVSEHESLPELSVMPFVALSNIVGSGGKEVADLLGQHLNWPVFDRELLLVMAEQDEMRARLYESMDERDVGWLEESLRQIMDQHFNRNDYFHRLLETVLCLARQGPAVFVGRAVHLILPRDRGLCVRLVASHEYRVRHFAEHAHVTARESARRVAQIDHERNAFIHQHFGCDDNDLSRFDVIINLQKFASHRAADLILSAMKLMGVV